MVLTEETIKVRITPLLSKLSKLDTQYTFQTSIEGTLSIEKTSHKTDKQYVLPCLHVSRRSFMGLDLGAR